MTTDTGTPPVIPTELQIYNSYVVDPQWQRKFSIIWPSVLGFFVLLALPRLVRSIRNGRAYASLFGISEDLAPAVADYTTLSAAPVSSPANKALSKRSRRSVLRTAERAMGVAGSVFYWTLPGLGLNAGQILIIIGYIVTVVLCIVLQAPLISNSNRAGFIALAQFPVVFLFATKNSVVSLLLGPGNGYEKLNFVHRWSGRLMFLGAMLHGALWIRNHLEYNLPILGQQKETSGVAALGVLGAIVLSSLRPVRRLCYEVFYVVHMLSFVAFFVTICYHTLYASPWIFPPLAFYGLDLLMRMFRHRIKDAVLVPIGTQMTLIHVPFATSGWLAGQHVRVRVFFGGRVFESHPLSIFSAAPDVSCITSMPRGVSFGARVVGDWTRALNAYAREAGEQMQKEARALQHHFDAEKKEKDGGAGPSSLDDGESVNAPGVEVPVQVMLDGPYGGCSVDLGEYETALLFAGGAGITFTLGILDDIVGRCVRKGRAGGEKTRRIEFSWCVRSFGAIDWFSPALMDIANVAASSASSAAPLDLHISIYVTCLCNPEAVPPIPNCDVTIVRPSIYRVVRELTAPPTSKAKGKPTFKSIAQASSPSTEKPSSVSVDDIAANDDTDIESVDQGMTIDLAARLPRVSPGGGLAVCASGPEGLVREAANAVARIQMSGRGAQVGCVGLHTEVFTL